MFVLNSKLKLSLLPMVTAMVSAVSFLFSFTLGNYFILAPLLLMPVYLFCLILTPVLGVGISLCMLWKGIRLGTQKDVLMSVAYSFIAILPSLAFLVWSRASA